MLKIAIKLAYLLKNIFLIYKVTLKLLFFCFKKLKANKIYLNK